jgi:ferric iron reductase protein FhuF
MVENPETQAAANDEEEREAIESYFLARYKYKMICPNIMALINQCQHLRDGLGNTV